MGISSRTLATTAPTPPVSISSVVSMNDDDDDHADSSSSSTAVIQKEPSLSSSPSTTITTNWESSGAKDHQKNAPLFVENPDHKKKDGNNNFQKKITTLDPQQKLGMILARSRHMPDTWYYSSNHVLVNQERAKRFAAPLIRMRGLDEIARIHAEQMAQDQQVYHVNLDALRIALQKVPHQRLGVNVQRGTSIRDIHECMMKTSLSNKNNIVDRRFTHMGMGTAVDSNGTLYLCQVFRG